MERCFECEVGQLEEGGEELLDCSASKKRIGIV